MVVRLGLIRDGPPEAGARVGVFPLVFACRLDNFIGERKRGHREDIEFEFRVEFDRILEYLDGQLERAALHLPLGEYLADQPSSEADVHFFAHDLGGDG